MNKKFEDMEFDEIKLYRREIVWRSAMALAIVILVLTCMFLMSVSKVSWSNQNRFRTISMIIGVPLVAYVIPFSTQVNKVMLQHPDWIRKSGFSAKIPLPAEWHIRRLLIVGPMAIAILATFYTLYKPNTREINGDPRLTDYSVINPGINYDKLPSVSAGSSQEESQSSAAAEEQSSPPTEERGNE